MPYSMTGFARLSEQAAWGEITCEIRSVNHRYLEPAIRLPELLRVCEPELREQIRKQLQRGKVEISFQLNLSPTHEQSLSIDTDTLVALSNAIKQINHIHPSTAGIDPLKLLQWPGVVEQVKLDMDAIQASVQSLANKTLQSLIEHRQREGIILQTFIIERLESIDKLIIDIRAQMPTILERQRNKLKQRLEEVKADLDASRVEQEIVMLMHKADIAEELDRLQAHLSEVKHILSQATPIGRRLDFMMQELNRETNTLSSKSLACSTSQIAVSIKVLIEQMREQIQNIE